MGRMRTQMLGSRVARDRISLIQADFQRSVAPSRLWLFQTQVAMNERMNE